MDISAITQLTRNTPALLRLAPSDTRDIILENIFALLQPANQLISMSCQIVAAGNTREVRYFLEPSEFLIRLISALRAQNYDFAILEHEISSLKQSSEPLALESSRE